MDNLYENYIEETKRSELADSDFGIPELRKFPLDTVAHVLSAIKFFNYVEPKYEKELASNIIKAIHKFNIEDQVHPGEKNRFSKYWNNKESVKESKEMNDKEVNKTITDLGGIGNIQNPALGNGSEITPDGNLNKEFVDIKEEYCNLPTEKDLLFESQLF